jgi:hypothetical protein
MGYFYFLGIVKNAERNMGARYLLDILIVFAGLRCGSRGREPAQQTEGLELSSFAFEYTQKED